jgi:hypothetical protein
MKNNVIGMDGSTAAQCGDRDDRKQLGANHLGGIAHSKQYMPGNEVSSI